MDEFIELRSSREHEYRFAEHEHEHDQRRPERDIITRGPTNLL